eukprot:scaffold18194_cov107-Skeletonema_dohrnii-CCMP3373.AAC.1
MNYGAQAYDVCNDRRIILYSIEYDEAVIAEDNMACSWGASGYLFVCIFTPSTPVDNILSLLQTYKLGVSNNFFASVSQTPYCKPHFYLLGLCHHLDVEMYTSSCYGHTWRMHSGSVS